MIRIDANRKLRDFTLDVKLTAESGETLVLMGNNGSGKTTVLNLVAGLMTPDYGNIEADGKKMFSSEEGIDVPPERRHVGYVFQNYALFPHMSVFDNVAFGLRTRKTPEDKVRHKVREELEPVGMWELKDVKAAKLSGGQKQKVALARSLVIRPTVLLMDEPLSALDARTHAMVRDSLQVRLRKDKITTVVVLHSLCDALALGDKACVMDRGQVVLSGKPGDILKQGQGQFVDNLFG
ncbi:ABC transporter ATP-binding protein [Methanocella sp. MCL-LM]|uniref:ABC transporter ATP-binding protein n=1 Tax=Methanocella sp. MCL-LM TaxID=3412035 RepID=UPI003C746743